MKVNIGRWFAFSDNPPAGMHDVRFAIDSDDILDGWDISQCALPNDGLRENDGDIHDFSRKTIKSVNEVGGTRTLDQKIKSLLLYQLSYHSERLSLMSEARSDNSVLKPSSSYETIGIPEECLRYVSGRPDKE